MTPTDKPAPRTARRGHVLVLGDDDVAAGCLLALGDEHDVVAMTSGRDAIERIRAGAEFDVMLCDVSGRDMGAIKFHAAIWKLAPRQIHRIVFLVDRGMDELTTAFLESARNQVLEKPPATCRIRELVRSQMGRGLQ